MCHLRHVYIKSCLIARQLFMFHYERDSCLTVTTSAVSMAVFINSSIFSVRFVSDFSIRSTFGFVTGCFATNIVQQSS